MKQLVVIHLFLNLYILAILQPSLPILEYLVNYDYIKNELCENRQKPILMCNGKCYLQKKIIQQELPDKDQQIPMPPKVDMEKLLWVINDTYYIDYSVAHQSQERLIFTNKLKGRILSSSVFKPPISLV